MPRVTVQQNVVLPNGTNVTVSFAGETLAQAQRLQAGATAHQEFVSAIANIMAGQYIAAHGIRAYSSIGNMDTYIHMPNTNNRDLMGFSNVDTTNHSVTIECTGTVNNNRHEFNVRGTF